MTLTILLTIVSIHMAALLTPGANFLVVAQTGLTYSRRTGLLTVAGVATGSSLYVTAGVVGFAALISQSPALAMVIRAVGAGYFAYMAYGLFTRQPRLASLTAANGVEAEVNRAHAYQHGLLTAIVNPASALYFLSLFTTFVPAGSTMLEKVVTGLVLVAMSASWYALLSIIFHDARVRGVYRRAERGMNLMFGCVWLLLAVRMLAP